jgi:hypothetical protein
MSKTLGTILSGVGSVVATIPGGQAIGLGLIALGTVTAALDRPPAQRAESAESAIKQPIPHAVAGYGIARQPHHVGIIA